MRVLVVALLELFRLAAGWLIVGYVLYTYTLVVGVLHGNIGGALVDVAIGIAVFLVAAV